MLTSSIRPGKIFYLKLVTENVVHQQGWALIADSGCNEIQGLFTITVTKPMPIQIFIK
jgi:hypothetical protein